jgi:MoaA/NifB/PqqE/SkfB family radical SAM enzyme
MMTGQIDALRWRASHNRNRFLQELGMRIRKPLGKPTEIYLKITHRCRTQCIMCNIWQTPNRPAEELSTDEWKTVLDDLRSWLGPYAIWIIGGEPFVRRDIFDLIEHAARIGLHPKIVTRGVGILKEEQARRLVESGLDEYHVSVEALDPAIHDFVSPPPGSLDKAIKGVEMINRIRRETNSPLKIIVKTIIMAPNADQLVPVVQWVLDNGLDSIKFQPIEQMLETPRETDWYVDSPLWPQDEESLAAVLKAIDGLIAARHDGAPIENSEFELKNMRRYFEDPPSMYDPVIRHELNSVGKDVPMFGHLEVWHDGEAMLVWDGPRLGNVLDQGFADLWRRRVEPEFSGGLG